MQLEMSVRIAVNILTKQAGNHLAAPGRITILQHGNREKSRGAKPAAESIAVLTVNRCAEIQGIGIVAALLSQGIKIMQQFRMLGVSVLGFKLQGQGDIARQQPHPGAASRFIPRNIVGKNNIADSFQLLAEGIPAQAQGVIVIGHAVYLFHKYPESSAHNALAG